MTPPRPPRPPRPTPGGGSALHRPVCDAVLRYLTYVPSQRKSEIKRAVRRDLGEWVRGDLVLAVLLSRPDLFEAHGEPRRWSVVHGAQARAAVGRLSYARPVESRRRGSAPRDGWSQADDADGSGGTSLIIEPVGQADDLIEPTLLNFSGEPEVSDLPPTYKGRLIQPLSGGRSDSTRDYELSGAECFGVTAQDLSRYLRRQRLSHAIRLL